MPESMMIAQFERRLIELGCPTRRLRERVRELADHREDLLDAGLKQGLTDAEAGTRADALLGNPILLADQVIGIVRQRTWWGRHPILGFAVLPLLSFIPALLVCVAVFYGPCWLLGEIFGPAYMLDGPDFAAVTQNPQGLRLVSAALNFGLTPMAVFAVAIFFCWLARRAGVDLKWVPVICASCAVDCVFSYWDARPRSLGFGFSSSPSHWWLAAVPLSVALVICGCRWRAGQALWTRRRFAPSDRFAYRTPTVWITTVCLLGIAAIAARPATNFALREYRESDLRARVWPAERAATLALLKSHESTAAAPASHPVDLRPVLNAALADSTDGPATGRTGTAETNNLAELSPGRHVFNGIPFDVAGKVQLAGKPLPAGEEQFPGHASIPINAPVGRIHLLHGACLVTELNKPVARVVVRYRNGNKTTLNIISGEDVLDWWGPIYNSDAGQERFTSSPGTQLAWAGSNPGISDDEPDLSLRLYQSAFPNPHPDWTVSTIEYCSALTGAAPFLVALTIDPP